jgi:hypothetical protein
MKSAAIVERFSWKTAARKNMRLLKETIAKNERL